MRNLIILICAAACLLGSVASFASTGTQSKIRALHLTTVGITPEQTYSVIDRAKVRHFNTLILGIAWRGSTRLSSTPWTKPISYQWSKRELVDVVKYARGKGLDIVLAVELLTHQEVFFADAFPDLMYNSSTYDPRKSRVYEIVFPLFDELIALIHPKAIHIGHDELAGYWVRKGLWHKEVGLRGAEVGLPAELFLKDVQVIYSYLSKRGVETWMWGDMLISPEELPGMNSAAMNGATPGYGKVLRDRIPKNIVICDWHYWGGESEFRSLDVFRREGFRVLGATWRNNVTTNNFSAYAALHGAEGMVATTWAVLGADSENVVRTMDELLGVIDFSGEAFARDFSVEK